VKFQRQHKEEISLNITPLIDVVFLLLIFFMVSTTFTRESHLQVELPSASGEKAAQISDAIEVLIDRQGQYTVNKRVLINSQLVTLKRAIESLSGNNNKLPFIVTADANTPHEYVVRAMDVAGQLGFAKLRITAQQNSTE